MISPEVDVTQGPAQTPVAFLERCEGSISFLNRTVTAAQLAARAQHLAQALSQAEVGKDHTVALLLPDSPGLIAATFAVLRLGARPQLLDPAASVETQAGAMSESGARLLATYDFQRLIDRGIALTGQLPDLRIGLLRSSEELPFPRNLLAPLLRASGIGQRPAHPAFFRLVPARGRAGMATAGAARLLLSDGPVSFAALVSPASDEEERQPPDLSGTLPLHCRAGFAGLLSSLAAEGSYRIKTEVSASSA